MQKLEIKNAGVQKVTAHEVKALGNIEFGPASASGAKASKLELSIFPKRIALRDVTAEVDLHLDLDIAVAIYIDVVVWKGNVARSTTVPLPLKFSMGLPDLIVKEDLSDSDRLSLSLDNVGLGTIRAELDPIVGSQLGALITEAVMENVAADRIELPVGGFQLEGLGLGSMAMRDLILSGLHVDKATVGAVSGALPLPRLVMKNLKIQRTSSTSMNMTGSELGITLAEKDAPKLLNALTVGWVTVTPKLWGGIKLKFGELSLPDPEIEGSIDDIELRGLSLSVKARDLQLSPIDIGRTSIGAIELADQAAPVTSVSVSPLFGGAGGAPFQDPAQDVERLAKIVVRASDRIDFLQATYELKDGSVRLGSPHGGSGGAPSSFTLNPGEHLVRMDGQHNGIVNRLRFHTDQGRVVSFGGYRDLYIDVDLDLPGGMRIRRKLDVHPGQEMSISLSPPLPDVHIHVPADVAPGSWLELHVDQGPWPRNLGRFQVKAKNTFELAAHEIVGFHGRSGAMLDAIGVLYV
jgi:hypothetical protein